MSNECPKCGSEYTHLNRRLGLWECEDCGHRFGEAAAALTMANLGRPAPRPAKVFLSYPHSSREICVMIRDALRARGHDVWFDEERMRPGDDRHASVAEGIDSHRTFVSCLTRDAVREGQGARGVCLDELSIALSTPGCVVQSVLLEPADVVRPTAAVAHRQWLDMSAWREMRAQGQDRFRPWFSERMLRLLEVLESEESRAFAGEVEEVRELLPLARWGTGREDLLARPLVGRAWLARQLESWMDDAQGGSLCALWGGPGVGKSAFSVHYAMASDRVAAAVCLSHGDVRYGTMSALAQSVAYQLACRLPDYRAELIRALRGTPVGQVGPSEVADLLFLKPLTYRHVDGGHEGVCVLVDGLDECAECERDAAVALLRRLRDGGPRWLRMVVVARPEPDLISALRPDCELWLRGEGIENSADVTAYLDRRLEGVVADAAKRYYVALRLAARSQGVFLFAEVMAESARLGGLDPNDLASLPATLDEALHGWLARAFPDGDEYARRFRPLVGAMLASPSPLPEAELGRLLGASESDVGDLRLRASTLLERGEDDFGEPTLSVAHRYVADWLASERSGHLASYPVEALRSMALACHRIATGDPGSLTGYEAAESIALCEAAGFDSLAHELRLSRGLAASLAKHGDWLGTWGRHARAGELHGLALEIDKARACELDTPEAKRDFSVELERVGDLARERGDFAAASDAFARSLAIREELAAELGTLGSRHDLSVALGKVGSLAYDLGDLGAAGDRYARALAIDEALAADLGTPAARCSLSVSLINAGDVARDLGNLNAAMNAYRRSLEVFETLAVELGTPEVRRGLAVALGRLGDLALGRGDLAAASDAWTRSLAIDEALAADLGTPAARSDFSLSLLRIGDLALGRGDLAAAGDAYARSMAIVEELSAELGTPEVRRRLSVTLAKVGDLALDRSDLDTAGDAYARSLAIDEALASELGTPEARHGLSASLERVGDLARERGDLAAAGDAYARSLEICEALAADLGTPEARLDLSTSLERVGGLARERGDLAGACDAYGRSLAIAEALSADLGTPEVRRGLFVSLIKVGDLARDRGHLAAAGDAWTRALAIAETLAPERNTPEARRDLYVALVRVGGLAEERGDLAGAGDAYARSLAIAEALASELGTPKARRELAVSYYRLAMIEQTRANVEQALRHFISARMIFAELNNELHTPQTESDLEIILDLISQLS